MNMDDISLIFSELGWKVTKDEAGDYVFLYDNGFLLMQLIPLLKKKRGSFRFVSMESVSTREFVDAVGYIKGEIKDYVPILLRDSTIEGAYISIEDLRGVSERLIEWAESQDIGKGLEAYKCLPTDSKGAMPLRHLAALAIGGGLDRLLSYQVSFEHGDRLGFVPYITKEMIDRAVFLAREAVKPTV